MIEAIRFIIIGYLSGSILFARICAKIFNKQSILMESKDWNPGTANAFKYGGFICGIITLLGDLAKGFIPVFLYLNFFVGNDNYYLLTAMVIAAPVVGHAFPLFFRFQGGKGIATSFGCLLGCFPNLTTVLIFALLFILFTVGIRITPHFACTFVTYIATLIVIICLQLSPSIIFGYAIMSATVILRLHLSKEVREKTEVKLFWMR